MTNHTLQKQMFRSGAALAALAVALGAFGTNQLAELIGDSEIIIFDTGIRYHLYHSLAIVLLSSLLRKLNEKTARMAWQFFIFGIIIFSGSLYLLATRNLTFGNNLMWLGGLAPMGGILFALGWGVLA